MKFVPNLFQGKPVSLEEGPAKYRSTDEYYVLHRDERRTNCGRVVQIVKAILCIELIILIGWLGCVSFSYYNTDRNTDCGGSAIGSKSLEIDYDDIKVKSMRSSRSSRSVGDTEDEQREVCERLANFTRRGLDSFVAEFVTGESSDPIVVQLRRNFTILTIFKSHQLIINNLLVETLSSLMGVTGDNATTNTSLLTMVPNDYWQVAMEELREEFVNSADSQTRQQLEARGPSTGEMAWEFRVITESFYVDMLYCDKLISDSLSSALEFNMSDEAAVRSKRESEPVSQLTIDCRNAEAQLLQERRERLKAVAATVAHGRPLRFHLGDLLTSIESALNATSPSEVTVEDDLLENDSGLIPWKRFMSNASLQLKKEFYELVRDEFVELRHANNRSSAFEDHDLNKTYKNWTDGLNILMESKSPEAVLNITIKFGSLLDLHYVKVETEDNSVDSETPAFGTLTYLGAEPEKPSIRYWRNILNGFVRLYFRVINRLGPCRPAVLETPPRDRRFVKKRFVDEPIPKTEAATCWNGEQEPALLVERRVRLLALALENATDKLELHEQNFFKAIETALNAGSVSEIHFAERYTRPRMMLTAIQYLTSNASLELHKEGYEIIRDLFLELRTLKNNSQEWKGYNVDSILANVTANIDFVVDPSVQSIFNSFIRIGEPFNLRYVELRKRDNGTDPDKPIFGEFTYGGEQPGSMGIWHMKHILDSFVKFYFKIQDPSGMCNPSAESHVEAGEKSTPVRD